MVTQTSHEKDALQIDRGLPATQEELFDAWTNPAMMQKFMVPLTTVRTRVKADVRVGGEFQISMEQKNDVVDHWGKYIEINRPHKLVFTWRSVHTHNRDSLVTVYFTPDGNDTRILLVHDKLPDDEARQKHKAGWMSILDHLADGLGK